MTMMTGSISSAYFLSAVNAVYYFHIYIIYCHYYEIDINGRQTPLLQSAEPTIIVGWALCRVYVGKAEWVHIKVLHVK